MHLDPGGLPSGKATLAQNKSSGLNMSVVGPPGGRLSSCGSAGSSSTGSGSGGLRTASPFPAATPPERSSFEHAMLACGRGSSGEEYTHPYPQATAAATAPAYSGHHQLSHTPAAAAGGAGGHDANAWGLPPPPSSLNVEAISAALSSLGNDPHALAQMLASLAAAAQAQVRWGWHASILMALTL